MVEECWTCEYCGLEYESYDDAIECEERCKEIYERASEESKKVKMDG